MVNFAGAVAGVGERFGVGRGKRARGFDTILTRPDFFNTNVVLKAGVYNTLGEYTIGAQELLRYGIGVKEFPDNQGYMFMELYDTTSVTAARVEGIIRLIIEDAKDLAGVPAVFQERTERLRGHETNRGLMRPLPEIQVPNIRADLDPVGRDNKMRIQIKADIDQTVAVSPATGQTKIIIPVTRY